MEQRTEVAISPSMLSLNECCLLEIIDFLTLDDSINLAGTCSRLRLIADRIFRKHSQFRLNSKIFNRGNEHIDNVFSYIGKHVLSLDINCYGGCLCFRKIMEITNACNNVNSLSIHGGRECENMPALNSFNGLNKLERLTLSGPYSSITERFLGNFYNLKFFRIELFSISPNVLKTVFQNNPNIESFSYFCMTKEQHNFSCELLELIPNIENLTLKLFIQRNRIGGIISEVDSLLKLDRLTKLKLTCPKKNINNFLNELARKGIIEELNLDNVQTDNAIFDILSSFDKLHLLYIFCDATVPIELRSSIAWPTKLKKLSLGGFILTPKHLTAIIQQSQSVETIFLISCYWNVYRQHFDVTTFSQGILHIIDGSERKQRLDIVLPNCSYSSAVENRSKEYLFDSEHLRILNPFFKVSQKNVN